jgi:hypothetical protein
MPVHADGVEHPDVLRLSRIPGEAVVNWLNRVAMHHLHPARSTKKCLRRDFPYPLHLAFGSAKIGKSC